VLSIVPPLTSQREPAPEIVTSAMLRSLPVGVEPPGATPHKR